ncbi:MFS transporter [Nonomuraea rhizosphaerae]|uniref:MFS transporter n=1 Tax=Nonomuraea rhizosphaerae TaxID=2665663 RepID=UPI001C5E4637|nr:MFS transporter [Nonomuraea rhizosphaerae]
MITQDSPTAGLPLRLARSASFAVVCVALAATGHWMAGGRAPGPAELAGAGGAVMAAAAVVAGRERSRVLIIGLLGAAQVCLHVLFGLVEHSGTTITGTTITGTTITGTAVARVAAPDLPVVHGESTWPGMFLCHAVATLLTAWWLAGGESALWSLLRRLAARAVPILTPVPFTPPPVPAAAPEPGPDRPRGRALRHSVVRRGPPLPAA